MATWNTDNPKVGNTIANDIPDIEENLQELHDVITAITNGTLGTTTAADFEVDVLGEAATMTSPVVTTGFNDGTQAISWPTNNMAAAKFMLGNSDTIIWMYLNTAPPGWKAITTGGDTVLGVSGGSQAYNVNGGTAGGTWTQPGHNHLWYNERSVSVADAVYDADGSLIDVPVGSVKTAEVDHIHLTQVTNSTLADSYTENDATVNTYRPSASVGKLFQLDTA